uniref:Uncharacterized protein n=1 Tax=Cajanus cajan TaxID=3821 RepID=A0A151RA77_CAJCA|nr:hypothetical protein KK1_039302 [Cajanus cajan]
MHYVDLPILCSCQEILPLIKICRRPETNYRLQQLHVGNEAAPLNQQMIGMHPGNGHNMRDTIETVLKQLIATNIHMATPVLQTNVSLPPQSMDVDQTKVETNTNAQAGNSIITLGSASFTNIITTNSVREVSSQTQNMIE